MNKKIPGTPAAKLKRSYKPLPEPEDQVVEWAVKELKHNLDELRGFLIGLPKGGARSGYQVKVMTNFEAIRRELAQLLAEGVRRPFDEY